MYRNGKPTTARVSANIQKTNRPTVGSASSVSGSKGVVTPSLSKQQPTSVRTSTSREVPQPSKSPSNVGKNNTHFHYHNDEDNKSSRSNTSRESLSKSKIEEEDDDDMEIMSVNDQHQYLKDNNKSSKEQTSSIKSSRSSRSNKSSRSNISEMGVSDDSIPLRLKKKVQIETPRERELRDSVSSINSTPLDEHNDSEFGEGQSVTSSSNSLHILSTVRKKLREDEEEQPVNTNPKPSKMAEYIKRFRNAPPTSRSERQRLDVLEDEPREEPVIMRSEKRIKEPEPSVSNSREDKRNWLKRVAQSSYDSSHPSIRNINQMKESIKQEIMDVDENIEFAKRYAGFDMDVEEEVPQSLSTRDHFSYMDTLDFDINELNNITDMALENGSFRMFGNMDNLMAKLSNDKNSQSKDSNKSEKKINDISDSSDEENLDEMFRKGVLSRLQSIGLHESYLDLESYDILSEGPRKEDLKVDNQVEELIKERNQVEQMINRNNSTNIGKKDKEIPKIEQDPNTSTKGISKSPSPRTKVEPEKPSSKYEISIDHEDAEEGFFPVVTIKSDQSPVVSQSMDSIGSSGAFESRQLEFVDEEELIARQQQNELTPPIVTESMDSILGKSIESVSSVSSANDNDLSTMGYCQRMIEQMVSSEPEENPIIIENLKKQPVEIDINDDNNELFTSDYICQTLRQKIDQLKNRLAELERVVV